MLYVINGRDTEDSLPARAGAREQHLGRIRALVDEGRLVLADPDSRLFRKIIPEDMAGEMQKIFRNKPASSQTPGT